MKLPLLIALLLLSSCAREAWRAPMVPDTVALLPAVPPGKYKFTGPVTITLQHGTGNVATPTATAKVKADAAATAPGAVAAATTQRGLSYWLLLVPVAGLLWWQRKGLARLLFDKWW